MSTSSLSQPPLPETGWLEQDLKEAWPQLDTPPQAGGPMNKGVPLVTACPAVGAHMKAAMSERITMGTTASSSTPCPVMRSTTTHQLNGWGYQKGGRHDQSLSTAGGGVLVKLPHSVIIIIIINIIFFLYWVGVLYV